MLNHQTAVFFYGNLLHIVVAISSVIQPLPEHGAAIIVIETALSFINDFIKLESVIRIRIPPEYSDPDFQEAFSCFRLVVADLGEFLRGTTDSIVLERVILQEPLAYILSARIAQGQDNPASVKSCSSVIRVLNVLADQSEARRSIVQLNHQNVFLLFILKSMCFFHRVFALTILAISRPISLKSVEIVVSPLRTTRSIGESL